MSISLLLMIVALILFGFAAFSANPRWNMLVAAGLACTTLAALLAGHGVIT